MSHLRGAELSEGRLLREFAHRDLDAVLGYIKTIAVNIVHDHFRSVRAAARGAQAEQIEQDDPVIDDRSVIERNLTIDQIEKVLTEATAGDDQEKQRTVFWLYYRQGLTAKQIAAIPTIGLKP